MEYGQIEIRSGRWNWHLSDYTEPATGETAIRVLHYVRPEDGEDTMEVELPSDWDFDASEVAALAVAPTRRKLVDSDGIEWTLEHQERPPIAIAVDRNLDHLPDQVRLVSKYHETRVIDLPEGKRLGELKRNEILALLKSADE